MKYSIQKVLFLLIYTCFLQTCFAAQEIDSQESFQENSASIQAIKKFLHLHQELQKNDSKTRKTAVDELFESQDLYDKPNVKRNMIATFMLDKDVSLSKSENIYISPMAEDSKKCFIDRLYQCALDDPNLYKNSVFGCPEKAGKIISESKTVIAFKFSPVQEDEIKVLYHDNKLSAQVLLLAFLTRQFEFDLIKKLYRIDSTLVHTSGMRSKEYLENRFDNLFSKVSKEEHNQNRDRLLSYYNELNQDESGYVIIKTLVENFSNIVSPDPEKDKKRYIFGQSSNSDHSIYISY